MKKLNFSIHIDAPRAQVWEAVIGKTTYPQWTEAFCPGSDVEGSWEQGSPIRFVGPNQRGTVDGMFSEIATNRPHEFLSIRHLGILKDGKEVTEGEEAKKWKDAYENYTLSEEGEGTLFTVELDVEEGGWAEYCNNTWPKALATLKEIAEKGESSKVTVYTWIHAPIEKVWDYYTLPAHITEWNYASDDWECPKASVDLRAGGRFVQTMGAKDGSMSFDFGGTYKEVRENEYISYIMDDGRNAEVTFIPEEGAIRVNVCFETEKTHTREQQRFGWQSILNNFKKSVELANA